MKTDMEKSEKKKTKYNYKKIALIIFGIVVSLVLVISLISGLINLIFGHHIDTNAKVIETDISSDYDYLRYKDQIVYMNSQGANIYSSKDKLKGQIQFGALNPYIHSAGDFSVLCDMNSSKLAIAQKGEIITNIEPKEEVMFAKINERGSVAAVTTEKGYKSSVYVYDKKGNEKYIWHSGEEFIIDCALQDNSKRLVVLSTKSVEGKIISSVIWFKTDEKQPYGQVILDNCFAYKLVYNGNNVCVIAKDAIYRIDHKGIINSVNFEGRALLGFDVFDGKIVTSQKLTNSKSVIVKYNKKLKPTMSEEVDFEANYVSVNKNKIALSGENNLYILTKWGNVYAKGVTVGEVNDILLSEKGDKIYSFSENKFKVYPVKLGRK